MAKTPLDKQIEKARKEAQKNAYKEELRQRAASIVHFTELSGRHSVLERPLSEVNGRLFFS